MSFISVLSCVISGGGPDILQTRDLCVLSCVVSGGGPDILLTTDLFVFCPVLSGGGPDILLTADFRDARTFVSVWCSVPKFVLPNKHLTHEHLGYKSRRVGVQVPHWGKINER